MNEAKRRAPEAIISNPVQNDDGLKIIISGMFGQINVGDEAICYADVDGLRRFLDNPRIRIITHDAKRSSQFIGVKDVSYFEGQCFTHRFWLRFPAFIRTILEADMIVVGGGGLFQDQYSWHLPAGSCLVAATGILFNIPTFVIGAGVGPLRRKWLKKIMSAVFAHAQSTMVRDSDSLSSAIERGAHDENILVTGDVVPGIDFESLLVTGQCLNECKKICFVLREWPGINTKELADLLGRLVDLGYAIEMHAYEPGVDDGYYERVLALCNEKTRDKVSVIVPATLSDAVCLLSNAYCVISMRYHGCVFSAALGLPLIPVVYERKVKNLAGQLGLDAWLKSPEDLEPSLAGEIVRVVGYRNQNVESLDNSFDLLRNNALENFRLIAEKMRHRSIDRPDRSGRLKILLVVITLLLAGAAGELQRIITIPIRFLRAN
jgi:polysaccharide pyruvyl transferase WcaK-like protein